ncbi:MAG: aldehyde dehydrogenase [Tidjanibacter sp.]|nr:aldehyde dehydrogenase [Tidjanibacter sp.]
MKSCNYRVELLVALGDRLTEFGHEPQSQAIIEQACIANEWFTPDSILRAVEAIRSQMLDREKLNAWLADYPTLPLQQPLNVAIIMAGNLPLVGFADMLYTLASGCKPLIKPSSKDPLPLYIATLINSLSNSDLVGILSDSDTPDVVIATGSDSSADYFRSLYPKAVHLIRGSRYSVALLSGKESAEELRLLGEDCFEHNGMGCRSVSRLLVPKGYDFAPLVEALRQSLDLCGAGHKANYRQTRALLTMRGVPYIDGRGFVLVAEGLVSEERLSVITFSEYDSDDDVQKYFSQRAEKIQCVVAQNNPFERTVPFGQTQHPTLSDYADGVDVIDFLSHCSTHRG